MSKNGLLSIRNLTNYWLFKANNKLQQSVVEKSQKAFSYFTTELNRGFNYSKKFRAGDFVWVQFGHNLEPELSFEHLALIIKRQNNTYYVLPITTPKAHNSNHQNAYHEIDNPNGNNRFIKIKKSDFPFLSHDSVIKSSELRAVSQKRILNCIGHISINDSRIKTILQITHQFYFPEFDYLLRQKDKEISYLKIEKFIASVKNEYVTQSLELLLKELTKDCEFTIIKNISVPINTSENQFSYLFELSDNYNQHISKTIMYTLT